MFTRIVATVLIITLTACTSFPPRPPSTVTQSQSEATVQQSSSAETVEKPDASNQGTGDGVGKLFGVVLILLAAVLALALLSGSVSNHLEKTCCFK